VEPPILHGMGALIRWVVLPLIVIALGAVWWYHGLALSIGENCEPDCVTEREVATWRWNFLAALGLWLIVVCAHFWSRRRERDEFRDESR
jgi:uncharacterized BrkB/YihY/UPF0761 family membrane protein